MIKIKFCTENICFNKSKKQSFGVGSTFMISPLLFRNKLECEYAFARNQKIADICCFKAFKSSSSIKSIKAPDGFDEHHRNFP